MQLEAIQKSDAEPYQRIDSRKAHRNGYKERPLKTRVGEIRLKKPQFREISFETKCISSRSSNGIPGWTLDQRVLFNFFFISDLHGALAFQHIKIVVMLAWNERKKSYYRCSGMLQSFLIKGYDVLLDHSPGREP